jgi:hypothetical protein
MARKKEKGVQIGESDGKGERGLAKRKIDNTWKKK